MRLSIDPLDMMLATARVHDSRPAIQQGDRAYTYGELVENITVLACAIASADSDHPRVAIHLEQGAQAYAAMFASLMAGGYYCPLNLRHPLARRNKIIDLFEPDVVIVETRKQIDGLNCPANAHVICLDERSNRRQLDNIRAPHKLSYVMFTSGSSGEPKGVMIGRQGLGHYTKWAISAMDVTPDDRWSQHPNIAFDLSVLDIYGALCAGACLFPVTTNRFRLAPALAIRDLNLSIWNSVPSVIDLMISAKHVAPEFFAPLRLMTFCGEPLLRGHLDAIFSAGPDIKVHNTYGPTEATVSCTLLRLDAAKYRARYHGSAALGEAIEGMQVDLHGGQTADEGEIVISGPQVGFGYWRRPDLTEKSFVIPTDQGKTRSYRTGDWAKRRNGEIFFVARVDRQAKRSGYRIELGDIDAAVKSVHHAAAFTVLVEGRLCSFIEGRDSSKHRPNLIAKLHDLLPHYMVPDEIRYIETIPRNANDKIDVNALENLARSKSGEME